MNKKVLFIGNFITGSRIKSPFEDLSMELCGRGWAVRRISRVKNRFLRLLDIAGRIILEQGNYKVAVVAVYSGTAFYWAEAAVYMLALLGKPVIIALHGGELPRFSARYPSRFKRLLSRAAYILTPSKFLQKELAGFGFEIHYLPNGVKLSDFQFKQRTAVSPRICWVRALHKIYDPETAVKTVALLKADFPGILMTLVGPDSGDGTLENIQTLVNEHKLQESVRIQGGVPNSELAGFFSEADIFMNTTTAESFGVSVMEAAASGLCVISSRAGEIPELWEDGKNALLFDIHNAGQAAAAVRRLLTDPLFAETLSRKGRERAEEFSWIKLLPQWEALLLEQVNRRNA